MGLAGASNTFDGGVNDAAITTANSGGASGTAFSAASEMTYSNAQAHRGPLSGMIPDGGDGMVELAMTGSGTRWLRAYVYFSDLNFDVVQMRMISGDYISVDFVEGNVGLASASFLGGVQYLAIQPVTIPAGWVRVELQGTPADAGTAIARVYTSPESSTPTVELSGVMTRPASTWAAARFGGYNESGSPRYTDSVAWSDVGWIGPLPAATAPARLVHNSAAVHRATTW